MKARKVFVQVWVDKNDLRELPAVELSGGNFPGVYAKTEFFSPGEPDWCKLSHRGKDGTRSVNVGVGELDHLVKILNKASK